MKTANQLAQENSGLVAALKAVKSTVTDSLTQDYITRVLDAVESGIPLVPPLGWNTPIGLCAYLQCPRRAEDAVGGGEKEGLLPFAVVDYQDELFYGFDSWDCLQKWARRSLEFSDDALEKIIDALRKPHGEDE